MGEEHTENLADFSMREIILLRDTLTAWIEQGLPKDFEEKRVRPMLNRDTGNVFLVNQEYQSAMLNGEKLESIYHTPIERIGGFLSTLLEYDPKLLPLKDREFIVSLCRLHELDWMTYTQPGGNTWNRLPCLDLSPNL